MVFFFSLFDILIKRIFYIFCKQKLRFYEEICLNAWKSKLSSQEIKILDKQLSLFNVISRQSQDKLVCFYYIKGFSYSNLPKEVLFPIKGEVIAAKIYFKSTSMKKNDIFEALIVIFNGRLFSIEFNKSPKNIFKANKKQQKNGIEIINVDVLVDLLAKNSNNTRHFDNIGILKSWLAEWARKYEITDLQEPLSAEQRDRLLKFYDTTFPDDYLEIISQAEGLKIRNCIIYGLSQIRTLVLPNENFYIIAEIERKGVIGLRQGNKRCELFYLDNEDHIPVNIGQSLCMFIDKEL